MSEARRVVTKVVQNPRRVMTQVIPPREIVITRVTAQQGPPGPGRRSVCLDIGDGESVEFVIEHKLGTLDVHITVRSNSPPYDDIGCYRARPTVDTVEVAIYPPPARREYRLIISEA
jgi:hypothetical protein